MLFLFGEGRGVEELLGVLGQRVSVEMIFCIHTCD